MPTSLTSHYLSFAAYSNSNIVKNIKNTNRMGSYTKTYSRNIAR